MEEPTVLVVDDDPDILLGLTVRLRSNGYRVITAGDAVQAGMMARTGQPDLVILDIRMPGGDGISLIRRLRPLAPLAPVFIITAGDPDLYRERAIEAGAVEFFEKPIDNDALLAALEKHVWPGGRG